MRTTKSTKVTLADPAKKATVFKAKRVIKPIVTNQSQIDDAVEQMKNADKEQELLKRELEKPTKLRNKALMEKYNILDSSKITDNYPDLNKGVNYDLDILFREDDGLSLDDRPANKKWYVGMTIPYDGNKFSYRFPIHKAIYADGQHLYKLDGFDVYVDEDGVIKNDISEYTIFQALTDYNAGNLNNGLVNDMFYKYKIISGDDIDTNILDKSISKNFAIKGHGVFVSSKVIGKDTSAKIVSTVTSGKQLLSPFTLGISDDGNTKLKNEVKTMNLDGGIFVPGVPRKIPAGVLVINNFKTLKTIRNDTPRYVILNYKDDTPDVLNASLLIGSTIGLDAAKDVNPRVNKTTLISWIQDNNKSAYDSFMGKIEKTKKDKEKADEQVAYQAAVDEKKEEEANKEKQKISRRAAKEAAKVGEAVAKEKAALEAAALEAKQKGDEESMIKKEISELNRGYKQDVQFSDFVTNVLGRRVTDKDAANSLLEAVTDRIDDDGLYIAGISKKLKNSFDNTITRMYYNTGDSNDNFYVAVLEAAKDDDGDNILTTSIFLGFHSLLTYFGSSLARKSKIDVMKYIIEHNQNVLKKVSK